MNPKAIIFDLDGTLISSLEDIANAMNHVLKSNGLPTHDTEKYNYFVGDGVHNLTIRVMAKDSSTALIEKVKSEYIAYYKENSMKHTAAYDGITELLHALHERNMPICVLSNKPDEETCDIVEKCFPDIKFTFVVGAKEGIPIKPDPTSAMLLAEALNVAPNEILYVGDTSTDMNTAKGAGMIPTGVLWGFRDLEELMQTGAKFIAKKPEDILNILDNKGENE